MTEGGRAKEGAVVGTVATDLGFADAVDTGNVRSKSRSENSISLALERSRDTPFLAMVHGARVGMTGDHK